MMAIRNISTFLKNNLVLLIKIKMACIVYKILTAILFMID